jgi:hypothetical protein
MLSSHASPSSRRRYRDGDDGRDRTKANRVRAYRGQTAACRRSACPWARAAISDEDRYQHRLRKLLATSAAVIAWTARSTAIK